MKYEHYTVWEFLEDAYFVSWVQDPDEQSDRFWKDWLVHNGGKTKEVQLARHIILHTEYLSNVKLSDRERIDIFEGIIQGRTSSKEEKYDRKRSVFLTLSKYAAVLIFSLIMAGLWQYYTRDPKPDDTVVPMVEKSCPRGSKLTVVLNDGSRVVLNAETTLRYPEHFSDSTRQVYLVGEAFFEIEENPAKPFVVVTGDIRTTVLGTSFMVRSYQGENEISVGVVEGRVKVSSHPDSDILFEHELLPRQMSVIDQEQRTAHKSVFEPEEAIAWKDWVLKFSNMPLKEIFLAIEKWYAVDIEVARGIDLEQPLSGSFDNETLKVVMEALGHNAEFKFKLEGRKILITPQSLNNPSIN